MTLWESLTYRDQPYVKVSPSEKGKRSRMGDLEKLSIYYVASADVRNATAFNVGRDNRFQAHAPWSNNTIYASEPNGGLRTSNAVLTYGGVPTNPGGWNIYVVDLVTRIDRDTRELDALCLDVMAAGGSVANRC